MLSEQQMKAVGRQRLVVPFGPAHDLLDADRPRLGNFLVALGTILVDRLPAVQEKAIGEVGVFGEGIIIPAADFAQGAEPNPGDRASMLRHETKIHARLLIHLIATGALEIEQSRQQIGADVQRDNAAHHAADFRIEERRDQLFDQARCRECSRRQR